MTYLLDTHVFLWWLRNDKRLRPTWKKAISNPRNTVFISVVSAWEMSIKLQLGKLRLRTSLQDCFDDREFRLLDITLAHVLSLHQLPLKHRDPFDRMLVAQAKTEGCTLITDDENILHYHVPVFND